MHIVQMKNNAQTAQPVKSKFTLHIKRVPMSPLLKGRGNTPRSPPVGLLSCIRIPCTPFALGTILYSEFLLLICVFLFSVQKSILIIFSDLYHSLDMWHKTIKLTKKLSKVSTTIIQLLQN